MPRIGTVDGLRLNDRIDEAISGAEQHGAGRMKQRAVRDGERHGHAQDHEAEQDLRRRADADMNHDRTEQPADDDHRGGIQTENVPAVTPGPCAIDIWNVINPEKTLEPSAMIAIG